MLQRSLFSIFQVYNRSDSVFSIFFTSHSVFFIFDIRLRVFHILYSVFSIFWRHTTGLWLRDSGSGTPTPELQLRVFHSTPYPCGESKQIHRNIRFFLSPVKRCLVNMFHVRELIARSWLLLCCEVLYAGTLKQYKVSKGVVHLARDSMFYCWSPVDSSVRSL